VHLSRRVPFLAFHSQFVLSRLYASMTLPSRVVCLKDAALTFWKEASLRHFIHKVSYSNSYLCCVVLSLTSNDALGTRFVSFFRCVVLFAIWHSFSLSLSRSLEYNYSSIESSCFSKQSEGKKESERCLQI